MATWEIIGSRRYIALTRKESADIIGLLAAQLAEEPLIGNHGGACPDFRVTDETGTIKAWIVLIVDPKHCDHAREIPDRGQSIIAISRTMASDILSKLGAQLAKAKDGFTDYIPTVGCPSVTIDDNVAPVYTLIFSVDWAQND